MHCAKSTLGSNLCLPVAFLYLVGAATPACAYRPFDGTDAAVADPGKMEVELQPAGGLHDESGTTLIAPATRLNFGVIDIRPGVLQDKTGPSIATEFGVLLPDSIGQTTFGASAAWIVSQRWDSGAIHLNAAATL